MNKTFRTYLGPAIEENDGIGDTAPNMAYSMREMLDRFARGLPLGGQKDSIFDDEEDWDDTIGVPPQRLDLAEIEAMQDALIERHKLYKQVKPVEEGKTVNEPEKHQE